MFLRLAFLSQVQKFNDVIKKVQFFVILLINFLLGALLFIIFMILGPKFIDKTNFMLLESKLNNFTMNNFVSDQ